MRVKRRSETKSSNDLYVIYFLFLGVSPQQTFSTMYTVFLVPWYAFGLAWIALLFNLFSKLLERITPNINFKLLCQEERTPSIKTVFAQLPKVPQTSLRNGETR